MKRIPKARIGRLGFTLMELLVVIALVAILVTVMVPVVLKAMKGKGLSMIGNNIAGFVAFSRTEAMNTRQTHVIVFYVDRQSLSTDSGLPLDIGPGMALYRINPNATGDDKIINYVKQLDFTGTIGGDVNFADAWQREAQTGPILGLHESANKEFAGKYKIAILPDGRLLIPEDKPGYVLDEGKTKGIKTDLVLTDDGERYVFIDFNSATGAVKRSKVVNREDTDWP